MLLLSLKGTLYGLVLVCTCAYRMWSPCSKLKTTSECMKCTVNMFRLHQDCDHDYIRKVVLRKHNCLLPVQIHGTYHCDPTSNIRGRAIAGVIITMAFTSNASHLFTSSGRGSQNGLNSSVSNHPWTTTATVHQGKNSSAPWERLATNHHPRPW